MKPYLKVGKWSVKEKQMVAEIEAKIAEKKAADPTFDFNPADDFEDLKKLYREMTAEDVEFTEHNDTDDVKTMTDTKKEDEFVLSDEKQITLNHTKDNIDDEFRDPFNEAEPIIRDYVKEDPFHTEDPNAPKRNTFDEPKTFDDAYHVPGEEDDEQIKQRGGAANKETGDGKSSAGSKSGPKQKADPFNPDFNSMDKPSKNKQTKRFAKRIVGAVSMLLEKGFVFWATRNINGSKLAEYEISGEMDLDLLISLDDGTQKTVREFFAQQCNNAETYAKISKDDQDELADALADVLMEKGITPTPTQVLIMSSLEIVGRQAITAIAMTAQTNALLAQLRAMKDNTSDADYEEQSHAAAHNAVTPDHPVNTAVQNVDVETLEQEENELMSQSQENAQPNVDVETNEEEEPSQETGLVKQEN